MKIIKECSVVQLKTKTLFEFHIFLVTDSLNQIAQLAIVVHYVVFYSPSFVSKTSIVDVLSFICPLRLVIF